MGWFGLGKKRSKFGKWLDDNGIKQEDFSRESGVSNTTISGLASGYKDHKRPIKRNQDKIIKTAKKYDPDAKDFWN